MHCLEISGKILVDFNKDFLSLSYFTSSRQLVKKCNGCFDRVARINTKKKPKTAQKKKAFQISSTVHYSIGFVEQRNPLTVQGPVTQD